MTEGNNVSLRFNLTHQPRELPAVPILRSQRVDSQETEPSIRNTALPTAPAAHSGTCSGHNNHWMNNPAGGLHPYSIAPAHSMGQFSRVSPLFAGSESQGPSSAANSVAQGPIFTRYPAGMNQYPWISVPYNVVASNPMASSMTPGFLQNPWGRAPLGYNHISHAQKMNFSPNMAGRPGPVYQSINSAQFPSMVHQSIPYAPPVGTFNHQPWVAPQQNAYGPDRYGMVGYPQMAPEGVNRPMLYQQMAPAAPADELVLNSGQITEAIDADISEDVDDSAPATDDAPVTIAPPVIAIIARGSGSRRYECLVCGSKFPRPSGLKSHSYSHTGERPFPCDFEGCKKAFASKSNLKRHQEGRTHTRIGREHKIQARGQSNNRKPRHLIRFRFVASD
ncbi:hypothetical protein RUND412_008358 [Rhizina undulata]